MASTGSPASNLAERRRRWPRSSPRSWGWRAPPEGVARLLVAQLNLALKTRVVTSMGLVPPPHEDEALIAETLKIVLRGIEPRPDP
jgi:hypothetical protein